MSFSIIQRATYSKCIYILVHIVHISLIHELQFYREQATLWTANFTGSASIQPFGRIWFALIHLDYPSEEGHPAKLVEDVRFVF